MWYGLFYRIFFFVAITLHLCLLNLSDVWGLDCSGAVDLGCIDSITVSGDTTGKLDTASSYDCVTWDESGPEDVYIIRPDMVGDIQAILTMYTADQDVFILTRCDPTSCLAFGNSSATLTGALPGVYYIVVDGFAGDAGSYNLTVIMPCYATPTPTPTGTWYSPTPTRTPTPTPTWTFSSTWTLTSTPTKTPSPTPTPSYTMTPSFTPTRTIPVADPIDLLLAVIIVSGLCCIIRYGCA